MEEGREYIDSTIELIEEGKKYKKMWEEHKEGIIFLSGDAHYKGAKILMDRIEQKYFPKEVIK